MSPEHKSMLLFIFGCVVVRSYLVYFAKTTSLKNLKIMGYIFLIPAIYTMYLYLYNKRQTGAEVFGKKIWWVNLRPIHSIIWFIFAYCAITGNTNSYKILAADLIIGILAFINHHYFSYLTMQVA